MTGGSRTIPNSTSALSDTQTTMIWLVSGQSEPIATQDSHLVNVEGDSNANRCLSSTSSQLTIPPAGRTPRSGGIHAN
jgi:hypothetical protein